MKVITDHKWKPFRRREEVPEKILRREFDWTADDDDDDDGFFKYKNRWYHLGEFMRAGGCAEWDGYALDSYFSGICIKMSTCGEFYKIGTYFAE